MGKMKRTIGVVTVLFSACVIVPTAIVLPFYEKSNGALLEPIVATENTTKKTTQATQKEQELVVSVLRSKTNKIEKIPLEEYVKGVVSSEMPARFELEALKAQALSARTYVLKKMLASKGDKDVTDTTKDQVYMDWKQLESVWKSDYQWKRKKIEEAVKQTEGQIILFQNQPITATFFSTSNGYTETSKEYWGGDIPYLQSVPSPWDKQSPEYNNQKVFSLSAFQKQLGVTVSNDDIGKIIKRTASERVKEVAIGGKTFSGKEVRERLELDSSDFTWELKGNKIIVLTKGFGHGVGMSQFGANGMAQEGKSYRDILFYYYKGVQIGDIARYKNNLLAKN
ncbi:MAG: stage II sporulation protein D [Bacillaceae bacterium]